MTIKTTHEDEFLRPGSDRFAQGLQVRESLTFIGKNNGSSVNISHESEQ